MSEPTCPNCGSAPVARGKNNRFQDDGIFVCRTAVYAGRQIDPTPACELIRSLREELAEARDAERDRIADHLELRASKLEDELAISETSTEIGLERMLAVIKSLRKEAMALRNNEHRSDT